MKNIKIFNLAFFLLLGACTKELKNFNPILKKETPLLNLVNLIITQAKAYAEEGLDGSDDIVYFSKYQISIQKFHELQSMLTNKKDFHQKRKEFCETEFYKEKIIKRIEEFIDDLVDYRIVPFLRKLQAKCKQNPHNIYQEEFDRFSTIKSRLGLANKLNKLYTSINFLSDENYFKLINYASSISNPDDNKITNKFKNDFIPSIEGIFGKIKELYENIDFPDNEKQELEKINSLINKLNQETSPILNLLKTLIEKKQKLKEKANNLSNFDYNDSLLDNALNYIQIFLDFKKNKFLTNNMYEETTQNKSKPKIKAKGSSIQNISSNLKDLKKKTNELISKINKLTQNIYNIEENKINSEIDTIEKTYEEYITKHKLIKKLYELEPTYDYIFSYYSSNNISESIDPKIDTCLLIPTMNVFYILKMEELKMGENILNQVDSKREINALLNIDHNMLEIIIKNLEEKTDNIPDSTYP